MIFPFYFIISFLLFNTHIIAQSGSDEVVIHELYRFPTGTRIQNLVVLGNGSLLLTLLTEPSLYRFDPKSSKAPVLVHRFPHQTSLLGVTQLNNKKTVALIAGNLTGSIYKNNAGVPKSFFVFLLDLSSARIIACFPIRQASLLVGITALPNSPHHLLLSDPTLALIWRLNTLTGAVDKAIADPIFITPPGRTAPSLGGIHVVNQHLYFTSQDNGQVGRIRINPNGTSAGEPAETRAYGFIYNNFGDFAVASDDVIYVTDPIGRTVARISPQENFRPGFNGGSSVFSSIPISGDVVDHPTAAAFASDSVKESVLYVVTAGFLPGYGGSGGGQVLKVELKPLALEYGGAGFH